MWRRLRPNREARSYQGRRIRKWLTELAQFPQHRSGPHPLTSDAFIEISHRVSSTFSGQLTTSLRATTVTGRKRSTPLFETFCQSFRVSKYSKLAFLRSAFRTPLYFLICFFIGLGLLVFLMLIRKMFQTPVSFFHLVWNML